MSGRRYPDRPVVGVGAIVLTADARVVLVRRAQPPREGEWSLPGGVLEIGEPLASGVAREVREETGLDVNVGPLVDTFEHISRDEGGRVQYHYVVLDYLCRVRGGIARASTDVSDVALADPRDLASYDLRPETLAVILKACRLAGLAG
ncbi:MAG TPA: NUDIX hydrolase [Vicinamibacterales bacterium]|jgi:ADP-ribose pyrophosphatase YjhB (NUDIX family)|nr:NUDIX hydrolase [Vicinamibacterales bacterium]